MKNIPILFSAPMVLAILEGHKTMTRRLRFKGEVGDRLWVRETYALENIFDKFSWLKLLDYYGEPATLATWYKTDDIQLNRPGQERGRWRSGRFMPKVLSRITLEVVSLRDELLQDITEEDAIKEGFVAEPAKIWWQGYREWDIGNGLTDLMHQQTVGATPPDWMIEPHRMADRPDLLNTARNNFIAYWFELNSKRPEARWNTNPIVKVIEFKRVEI